MADGAVVGLGAAVGLAGGGEVLGQGREGWIPGAVVDVASTVGTTNQDREHHPEAYRGSGAGGSAILAHGSSAAWTNVDPTVD